MNIKFCPVPWLFVSLKNNGDYRVCCHANTSEGKGLLKKQDDSSFNIASDKINDARQSQLMNEIRLSMLENKTHSTCVRCDKEDLSGIHSRRQYENERAEGIFSIQDAFEVTNTNGSLNLEKAPVRFMDLRFGNLCNLKCRMCGPADSDFWYDDYVKLWGNHSFQDGDELIKLSQKNSEKWIVDNQKFKWIEQPDSWSEIKINLEKVEYIHIVGGEPLLVKGHLDVLKECISRGLSRNVVLEYNTNLSILPEEILLLWSSFKKVRVGISIDGIKEVNNYIRHPSKWEKIEKNLNKLIENNTKNNFEIWFSLTYQAYNAFHIVEVLEWVKSKFTLSNNEFLRTIVLKTHPLHKPDHLSVKIFPEFFKKEIAKSYTDYLYKIENEFLDIHYENASFSKFFKMTKKTLLAFIDFMNQEDLALHFDEFLRVTKKLDNIRAENICDIIPELGEIIYAKNQ